MVCRFLPGRGAVRLGRCWLLGDLFGCGVATGDEEPSRDCLSDTGLERTVVSQVPLGPNPGPDVVTGVGVPTGVRRPTAGCRGPPPVRRPRRLLPRRRRLGPPKATAPVRILGRHQRIHSQPVLPYQARHPSTGGRVPVPGGPAPGRSRPHPLKPGRLAVTSGVRYCLYRCSFCPFGRDDTKLSGAFSRHGDTAQTSRVMSATVPGPPPMDGWSTAAATKTGALALCNRRPVPTGTH